MHFRHAYNSYSNKMAVENIEEGLPKNPCLELAQLMFHLEQPEHKDDDSAKTKLIESIKANSKVFIFSLV